MIDICSKCGNIVLDDSSCECQVAPPLIGLPNLDSVDDFDYPLIPIAAN